MPKAWRKQQRVSSPLAVGPVTPRPLAQARQIRPAAPADARKPWDPAGSTIHSLPADSLRYRSRFLSEIPQLRWTISVRPPLNSKP